MKLKKLAKLTKLSMKICLINNLYPPNGKGGAEVVTENIARGLKDAGHEVFVITTAPWQDKSSLRAKSREVGGIKIYEFYPLNIYHYSYGHRHNLLARYLWHFIDILNLHSFFIVKKILADEKPDIVWTHNLMGAGMLAAEAIKLLGLRHWHTVHDVQLSLPSGLIIWGEENNAEAKSRFRPLYERVMRDILGKPEIIFSPSKWLLDFYIGRGFFGKSKQIVLQNPVNLGVSGTLQACRVPETRESKVRFLYLGQIEEHKGLRMLVKTFRHLLNEGHDNLELTVAGSGALLEDIRVLAFDEERIKILGSVSHEKIGELFAAADYLVVPSLCYENSPTVIFESLSYGVAVIASNLGGIPETIRDGENGYLFNAHENSLKDAIMRAAALDPFGGAGLRVNPVFDPESSDRREPGRGLDNYANLCQNGYVTVNELSMDAYIRKISSFF